MRAIHQADYLRAMNSSEDTTLVKLAGELGLDIRQFSDALNAPGTQRELEREIELGRSIGAEGFPSLILECAGKYHRLHYSYLDPAPLLAQLSALAGCD